MLIALMATALAQSVDGSWVLDTPAAEVVSRQEAAVGRALRSWPQFAMLKARTAIVEANPTCLQVVMSLEPAFQFSCDDRGVYQRSLEGDHTFTDEDGRSITTRLERKKDVVWIDWAGEEGTRRDTWRREGEQLVVEHRITSPFLPRAIRWEVRYRPLAP